MLLVPVTTKVVSIEMLVCVAIVFVTMAVCLTTGKT